MAPENSIGVKVGDLWNCGMSDFPEAAEIYARLATILNGGDSPRGGPGRVFERWALLRDELHSALMETSTNLYDTGEALVQIAELYAAADADSAAEIQRHKNERRNSIPAEALNMTKSA